MKTKTKILAIESSCDETAAAVVADGREVLSNIISSQIEVHTIYGGVVPEIASRKHLENIDGVIQTAMDEAHCGWEEIDAIAVTCGPGLVGALLGGCLLYTSRSDLSKRNGNIKRILGKSGKQQAVYPPFRTQL